MIFQPVISPLPLIPSRLGRGNLTFYEFINVRCSLVAFLIKLAASPPATGLTPESRQAGKPETNSLGT
jgi:hypothetical protein